MTTLLLVAVSLSLAGPSHAAFVLGGGDVVVARHAPRRVPAPDARHAYSAGHDRGHRDGLRSGARDAHRARHYSPRRHRSFREGDHGYRGRLGPRAAYVSGYRRGFERAYHRTYVRVAGFHPPHDGYCNRHGRRYSR